MKKELLEQLKQKCSKCECCELCITRQNIVFADGNPETAKVILIGEAPGEREDLTGLPFVGRAGKLLDEFLEKAGISRQKDLYIINTVKCRPPKNRVPTRAEKEACRPFLLKQIEIIDPEIILLCGATALASFCDKKIPISKIRGEILEIEIAPSSALQAPSPHMGEGRKYKSMPIFHPSYLLRNHSLEENSPRDLMLKDLRKAKKLI